MTDDRLHHLLDRMRRGALLPAEGEQLAGLVGELEAENAQLRDWLAHCRHKPRVAELEAEITRLTAGQQPASPVLPGDRRTCCDARIGHYPGCPANQPSATA